MVVWELTELFSGGGAFVISMRSTICCLLVLPFCACKRAPVNPVNTPNAAVITVPCGSWEYTQIHSNPANTEHQKSVTMLPPEVASESKKVLPVFYVWIQWLPPN